MPGRVPSGGSKDTIEYTQDGGYIFANNPPVEYRDKFPEETKIPCEYYDDRVVHILKPARRSEFLYTLEDDDNLLIITDSSGGVWKLERKLEKIRSRPPLK